MGADDGGIFPVSLSAAGPVQPRRLVLAGGTGLSAVGSTLLSVQLLLERGIRALYQLQDKRIKRS